MVPIADRMPSTRFTRRRLLTAAGGCLSVGIAGCAGTGRSESVTETADDGVTVESSHEYETMFVRSERASLFVYRSEDAADDADDQNARLHGSFVLTDADDAAELVISDDADADAADIRSFVEATDFGEASVSVDHRPIDDCYRRNLLGVRADDDSVQTDYCRELKPPTAACEAEKTVTEAVLIRIHRPYEDPPSSRSSSERASCGDRGSAGTESSADETAPNESESRNASSRGGADERTETNGVTLR